MSFLCWCPQYPALGLALCPERIKIEMTAEMRRMGAENKREGKKAGVAGSRECAAPPPGGSVEGARAAPALHSRVPFRRRFFLSRTSRQTPRTRSGPAAAPRTPETPARELGVGTPGPRQVQPSHPRSPPAAQGQHHACRRGGSGPAGVERSLRPVLGAPPQVSTPAALGSRPLGASWGPPAFRGPSPGAPPPTLPGLLSSWGLRASLLRCFSHRPRLAPLSCLQPPGLGEALRFTRGKKVPRGPAPSSRCPEGSNAAEVVTRGRGGNAWPRAAGLPARTSALRSRRRADGAAPRRPHPRARVCGPRGGCRKGKRREPA